MAAAHRPGTMGCTGGGGGGGGTEAGRASLVAVDVEVDIEAGADVVELRRKWG